MKKISIVGVEGSGKTVLMSVLGDAYSSPDANGLFLNPVNRETFEYCTKTVAEMRQGFWPDVTEPGKTVTLQWRLGKINAGKLSTELCEVTMMDFAGEVYRQAFADNPLNESTQEDVRGLREYISECDGLLLLINLKDVIDGNRAEQRTIDMLWTSKSILDYAAENGVRGVAIAFTQADRYTSIIEECGGLSGVLKKHFPLIGAVYPDIRLFAVSAVGQTVLDEKRNEVPAEDFVSTGFEDVMMWMSGVELPKQAPESHLRFSKILSILLLASLVAGGALYWNYHQETTSVFFESVYNVLRQDTGAYTEIWFWLLLIIGAGLFFFRLTARKSRPSTDGNGRISSGEVHRETLQTKKKSPSASSDTIPTRKKSIRHGTTKKLMLPGGVTMEMIYVEPGEFMMGSPANEVSRHDGETQHRVRLTKGYWLGKYSVTQKQWKSVMNENPSLISGGQKPVTSVSWHDCQNFISKVKSLGISGARLPTEAEWEYACRAGTTTVFSWGDVLNGDKANCNGNCPYGTTVKGSYKATLADVGSYKPNAWGFYDMHGNIWEWCQDYYKEDYYTYSPANDPKGPAIGDFRVHRGGCWNSFARLCRSAARFRSKPNARYFLCGFRLACSIGPDE